MKMKHHVILEQTDPRFVLYSQVITEINAMIRLWHQSDGMSEDGLRQAIAGGLMAQAAHYFRHMVGTSKEAFLSIAEEEFEMRDGDLSKAAHLQ